MLKLIRISMLFIILLALCVPTVWARLSGVVEWGYANYEESSDSGADLSASHFTQRYSLMNSMQGLLGGGRLGAYDLGLGAEWAAFDSDFDGEGLAKDAFKLLYKGRLQIAPGGLPFRLDAYSYDLAAVTFGRSSQSGLINPYIVDSLYDGQTIVSGVQFMAGIRNGSYRGRYRDSLSKWPRILLDYRDVYHRDLKARVPQEFRDRDLAFVSLNKKDNWFHYRVKTHTDYQNPQEDSSESTIMLGTIDHTLKRQWIDLTNWIRISVDGSYSVFEPRWDPRESNRYDVNFFTTMRRDSFSAASLVNLQRVKLGTSLEHTFDLPVYITNRINPDTSLSSNFELWRNKETTSFLAEDRNEEAYHAKFLLEANQRARVQLTPSLEVELHTGNFGEGEAVRGRIEANSNPMRRRSFSWFSMASLASFSGNGYNNEESSLWEGELRGGADYRLNNKVTMGGNQYLLYGSGTYGSNSTHFMSASSASGFGRYSGADSQYLDGSLFRSETLLYVEHTSRTRVQNRFEMDYKFEQNDVGRLYNLELAHKLNYRSRWWRVKLENIYAIGDDTQTNAPGIDNLGKSFIPSSSDAHFEHRGMAEYRPNNYWQARLEESYFWGQDSTGQTNQYLTVKQSLQRTFFHFGGLRRKRGEVTQSLTYQQYQNGSARRAVTFSLGGDYFPKSWLRMGAYVDYYYRDYTSNFFYCTLTSGLDFPKFNVDFSYRYGASDENNVVAHRYELNVRKTF